jgi:predicted AAA+ superfamily ATPase
MLFKRKATDKLKQWKEQSDGTYAALLEGARRTGKSTIAEAFAKVEYQSYIKVDFAEVSNDVLNVFSSLSLLDDFFLRLQAVMGVTLYPRKSVIIFDEVQLQPKVRQAIKYLVKDRRYDYIETGSLLSIRKNVKDIVIPSEEWKIPVYPMDYEEFLWATGRQDFSLLRQMYVAGKPVGQAVNRSLMRDYRIYMAVGGMPQAVDAYLEKKNFQEIDRIKRGIVDLYEEDFFKIDPSGRISLMFESIPAQLARNAKRFTFYYVWKKKVRDKDYELLADLINSRTVLPCYHCHDPQLSLSQGKDPDTFKLYLSDTGLFVTLLLKTKTGVDESLYARFLSDTLPANLGFLYENAVAQTFASRGEDLYYMTWLKLDSTHSYEVDFLLSKGRNIIPIEVKSSRTVFHASLDAFCKKYSSLVKEPYMLSQKDISHDSSLRTYPFYLASCIGT